MTIDVLIIGGGISGLSAAAALHRHGIRPLLVEADAMVGGALRSERTTDGFLLEHGPNTVTSKNPALWRHFADLGIAEQRIVAQRSAATRYIVQQGTLVPIPMSPPAFLRSPLLSFPAKLRLLLEPLIPRSRTDASVAAFFTRRLGREPQERLVDPFVSGVYAGDPDQLSLRAAFPSLWEAEQRAGSMILGLLTAPRSHAKPPRNRRELFSFRDGLATWPQAIAHTLGPEQIWTRARAVELRPTDGEWHVSVQRGGTSVHILAAHVILATPAAQSAALLQRIAEHAAAALRSIAYPPVTLVHLGYRRSAVQHPIDGFGMLCPSTERAQILGTLWPSTIFPNRAPTDSILTSSFVGGARNPQHALQSDAALISMVHSEQQRLIGAHAEPIFSRVVRWPQAIPQYKAGHLDRIATLEQCEAQWPGLHLLGNYRGGISVEACWQNGIALAEQIATDIRGNPC